MPFELHLFWQLLVSSLRSFRMLFLGKKKIAQRLNYECLFDLAAMIYFSD